VSVMMRSQMRSHTLPQKIACLELYWEGRCSVWERSAAGSCSYRRGQYNEKYAVSKSFRKFQIGYLSTTWSENVHFRYYVPMRAFNKLVPAKRVRHAMESMTTNPQSCRVRGHVQLFFVWIVHDPHVCPQLQGILEVPS
jgi:hypothetical protein